MHVRRPGEVLHFDYLYVGDSSPLGKDGLDEGDGFNYILVMMDDLSNLSDTALQLKDRAMKTLEGALRVEHRFAVANSSWSNGTCERMMREVVRALKTILQEERRDIREWVDVVPAVQWALNTAYCERYASTPYHVMFGRAPSRSFSNLASSTGED